MKEGEIVEEEKKVTACKYIRTIGVTRHHYTRSQLAFQLLQLIPEPFMHFTLASITLVLHGIAVDREQVTIYHPPYEITVTILGDCEKVTYTIL